MKSLNVPRIVQTPKSCSVASLLEIFSYFNKEHGSVEETLADLAIPAEEFQAQGVAEGSVGLYAAKKGFLVDIYSIDTKRFDPTWDFSNKESLIVSLQKQLDFHTVASEQDRVENYSSYYLKITTLRLLELVKHPNVTIHFQPLSHVLIQSFLDESIPLFTVVNYNLLANKPRRYRGKLDDIRGRAFGHSIVISGYDENFYEITDPDNDLEEGIYKVDKDFLLNAVVNYGPILMVLRPKNE